MVKWTLSLFLVLVCVSFASAQTPFQDDQQAYQYGYREGYQHGMADMHAGLNFDYTHAHSFQSGISYDSYTNVQFRSGYVDGYKDGFYGSKDMDHDRDHEYGDDHHHDENRVYSDDDHHERDYDNDHQRYDSDAGTVKVYTKDRFDGSHETFHVGQYPYLDGKWHKNIESVEVRGPVRVILFEKPNFRGKRMVVQNDIIDMDDYHFKDKAQSMIVERLY
jgi:hypothetical protein